MEEISPEAIRECQNGSVESFAAIVEEYGKRIFSYVYRFLFGSHMRGDAEDLTQEIFVKAYCKINSFDLERGVKFSTWLYTIARNHCVSALRRDRGRTRVIDMEMSELQELPDSKSAGLNAEIMHKELSQEVARAIAMLPEEQKTTVLLQYYECLTYEEIAHIMSCSIGTVKSRLARARGRLYRDLKEYVRFPMEREESI